MRHRINKKWQPYYYYDLDNGETFIVSYRIYKGRVLFSITPKDIKEHNLKFNYVKERRRVLNTFKKTHT